MARNYARSPDGPETKTPSYPAYQVVVYHDDPDDAAADSLASQPYRTITDAKEAIAEFQRDPYWNGGAGIYGGIFHVGSFERPEWFEDNDRKPVWSTWGD